MCYLSLIITCSDKLSWFNKKYIIEQSLSGEAWSKDWINRKNKSLNYESYIENLNWVKTWSNNHFKIVVEKTSPVLIFLIINFLLIYFTKCLKKNFSKEKDYFFIFFFCFSILTVFLWFIKFPLYRFGVSYIYLLMTLISYFLFMRNINLDKFGKFKSIFLIIICISFLGLLIKNVSRIYNTDNIYIYPSLINFDRVSIVQEVFDLDNEFTHYKSLGGAECGVSKSPCTHFDVNIKKNTIFGYKVFKTVN